MTEKGGFLQILGGSRILSLTLGQTAAEVQL